MANFFDWFFEIGYSEIVFADRAIFYEGDTERLYIRKVMTLEKYKKLKQQYVAFIQVGGAYAKNYEKLIKLLGIKSLIITDIDYGKSEIVIEDVKKSKTTNATIEYFYSINNSTDTPTVEELYSWKETGGNIIEDLIYVCFQTKDDGYARTLEEAMINKYFDMDVSKCYKKSDWKEKRKDSELKFSIPRMKNKKEIADDDMVSVRDILAATSGNKTDFMCSVIMKDYVKKNNGYCLRIDPYQQVESYLLRNPKDNILCITYTNRAAEELGRDLEQSRVYFGTIHSFINDFIGSFFSHKEIIDLYWEVYETQIIERIKNTEQKETWTEGAERYKEKYGSLDLDTVRSNINKISYNETPFNSLLYGGLGHNDLITFTKLAVDRFPIIKKKISDKYQLIFIDEYQDTSA